MMASVQTNTDRADSCIIANPAHYVKGRTIQPIDVIDAWNLPHHLACSLKYLARVGRKNSILEDLKKAEWYLDRTLSREGEFHQNRLSTPLALSYSELSYTLEAIIEDWQLSDLLCSTLINIFLSKDSPSPFLKQKALKTALECLREEITIHEREGEMHRPIAAMQLTP